MALPMDLMVKAGGAFCEWVDDVGDVDVGGGDFMEHEREADGVFATDESDLNLGAGGDSLVEFEGRVDAADAPTEDQGARFH